ncbi:hypothetical protein HN51_011009 [Arachis hypogaea]
MTIETLFLPTGIAFPTPTDVFILKPNLLLHLSSLDYYQYSSGKIRFPVETKIQLKKCFRCKLKARDEVSQNADFLRQFARKEKKPFPTPIVDQGNHFSAPKNGLLVKSLIPTAYNVYNARITLINNLKKLLKVVSVHACGWCSEIHVGPVGHPFKSCKGAQANLCKGLHEWMKAHVEDMIIPIEAYHLEYQQWLSFVFKLVRRKPIIRIGRKEYIDADESEVPNETPAEPLRPLLAEIADSEIVAPSSKLSRHGNE